MLTLLGSLAVPAQAEENEHGVTINRKPLRDLGAALIRELESGEIDLKALFHIEFEAAFDTSSMLDVSKSRIVKSEGDERLVALAKDAIVAVGESGFFSYLTRLDPATNKITIKVSQTADAFGASVTCLVATPEEARRNAASLNMMFSLARMASEEKNLGDALLLKGITVSFDGTNYTIKSTMPAAEVQKLIKAELDKHRVK